MTEWVFFLVGRLVFAFDGERLFVRKLDARHARTNA